MREIVFVLEFRGKAGAVPGSATQRQARTTAPSQLFETVLGADGVHTRIGQVGGDVAVLESRVERSGDGSFVEDGTITYGRAGSVSFDTIGRGWVGPSAIPGLVHGGVVWRITGGSGALSGARGIITSNFTVNGDGDVVDDHVARLFLP
jgi:hypothetical protein